MPTNPRRKRADPQVANHADRYSSGDADQMNFVEGGRLIAKSMTNDAILGIWTISRRPAV
jgi:hypothetical protein